LYWWAYPIGTPFAFDFPPGITYIFYRNMSCLWPFTALVCPEALSGRGSGTPRGRLYLRPPRGRSLALGLLLLLFCLAHAGCRPPGGGETVQAIPVADLDEIRARGKLVAATGYGATSYFIYKGRPMGFEYELLERLARHLDVELEILIIRDMDRMFEILDDGEADIIGLGLTVTTGSHRDQGPGGEDRLHHAP